jgi:PadR family transcriptional regulator PadR
MDRKQAPGCNAGRKTADRFLEACLLQLLSQGTGHGYVLMEQLQQFGISTDALNISTLYRTLRHMEKEGCLESEWEEGGPGPKRRIYLISEKGKKELEIRIRMMKARKSGIDRLINAYDRAQEQAVQTDRPGKKEEMP